MEPHTEAFSPAQPLSENRSYRGFTLIELSIVLVVIGLLVGGVLVGRDLIKAAEVRAQVSQIEHYQTAVNTFKGKYAALPGDMLYTEALKFGLYSLGGYGGEGDGNGLLQVFQEGSYVDNAPNIYGEHVLFWVHLKQTNLVTGDFLFNAVSFTGTVTGNEMAKYLPPAKLGDNAYVSVYAGADNASNYFDLAKQWYEQTDPDSSSGLYQQPSLTVQQAYAIDKKMDDGLPLSGKVLAAGVFYSMTFSNTPVSADDTTCYDKGGVAGATARYSITWNNGLMLNCVLSFKFQ